MYDYLLDKLVNDKVIVLLLVGVLFFPFVSACSNGEGPVPARSVETLRELTGVATRLVWVQDLGENRDVFTQGKQLRLMGFDSEDGKGERAILAGPENFVRPLISPSGKQVVFSNSHRQRVELVDWSGKNRRVLTNGLAVAVWGDPVSGIEWVYVARSPLRKSKWPTFQHLYRVQLKKPAMEELIWDKTVLGTIVQFSGDGKSFVAETPWPHCTLVNLNKGKIHRYAKGCWPALAPDQSGRAWFFDDAHKNLEMIDMAKGTEITIPLSNAAGIDGYEVYHPRWANHPRYMVMSGPYTIRKGGNRIRGGGAGVEIHAGRFNRDYTAVEAWVQVSSNQRADFYPDMWVGRD